jgi:CheY-like chemotaxis protein
VIEDNHSIRKLFKVILEKRGIKVTDFEEARPALEWIAANKPDFILCDDILPDLHGKDVLAAIKKIPQCTTIPVVIVTGFAHANDHEKYLAAGFSGYIAKPINTSSFADEVLAYVR